MRKIIFATNNKHKLEEVKAILKNDFEIISLSEIGCNEEIPETADTLEGNAALKAKFVFERYGIDCFADDTGLEIEALNGRPGVYSARYAGVPSNSNNNLMKVLKEMEGQTNRNARFRTVICFIENAKYHYFEGIIKGKIAENPQGTHGFGYDPIFIPDGYDKSFAAMNLDTKNSISHRALAIRKFTNYLKQSEDE
jgi:XTP/dITP diphosphohydrolase